MDRRIIVILVAVFIAAVFTACAGLPTSIARDDSLPDEESGEESEQTDCAKETEPAWETEEVADESVDPEAEESVPFPLPQDVPLPFADLTDGEIHRMVKADLSSLGALSIGYTNSGALINAVQMPQGDKWEIVNPRETWGTPETIGFLVAAIEKVHEVHPDTAPLHIGDISDPDGGRLNRHLSHQAGRDVDTGFFFKEGKGDWYTVGTSRNLDLARNWAFVRAMLVHTDVELILLDKKIQCLLYDYALSVGEDREWLDSVFQYPGGRPNRIIRYSRGHHTHYHFRFYNVAAQEMGRRAYPFLLKEKKIKPPTYYVWHKVRSGETLGHLARRYGSSVSVIKQANGLRSTTIRAGKSYRIPRRGGVSRVPGPMKPPARHVPPTTPSVLAAADWAPAGYPVPTITPPTVVASLASTPEETRSEETAPAPRASYVVKAGDTLSQIAERSGVGVAELKRWNNLKSTSIRVGQKLVVGGQAATVRATQPSRYTYKVASGDNLWSIARKHDVTVGELKAWNGLKSDQLSIGQKLWVRKAPSGRTQTASASTYTVRSGDNLWSIAKRQGVSVQDLRSWNGLTTDALQPGQKLALQSAQPIRTAAANTGNEVRYRVKSGDNLWTIAQRHGVSVDDVRDWNRLTSDMLSPGQSLVLYPVR